MGIVMDDIGVMLEKGVSDGVFPGGPFLFLNGEMRFTGQMPVLPVFLLAHG